jgi:hypothetical protein
MIFNIYSHITGGFCEGKFVSGEY